MNSDTDYLKQLSKYKILYKVTIDQSKEQKIAIVEYPIVYSNKNMIYFLQNNRITSLYDVKINLDIYEITKYACSYLRTFYCLTKPDFDIEKINIDINAAYKADRLKKAKRDMVLSKYEYDKSVETYNKLLNDK